MASDAAMKKSVEVDLKKSVDTDMKKSVITMDDSKKKSNKSMVLDNKKKSRVSMINTVKTATTKSLGTLPGKSMSRMKMRKQSYGFSGISGIRNVERTSQIAIEFKRPALSYLPTYQLEPSFRFNPIHVTRAVDEILDEYFSDYKYNRTDAASIALDIAGYIMRAVKEFGFNRYRVIAVVTIGQKRAQGYSNAVAFLWDHERDDCVDLHRELHTSFIQATVFGVYLD